MAYPAREVADAFIAFCNEHGDTLTNLKLQKLLYYAQGWYLAMHDEPLFNEPLEAWIRGPVVPEVFREFKDAGAKPIGLEPRPLQAFPSKLMEHVKDVWEAYGDLSSFSLERLSHNEPPWRSARQGLPPDAACNHRLDLDLMRAFFKEQHKNGNQTS
jgi:uncharacterized phage-associated protein